MSNPRFIVRLMAVLALIATTGSARADDKAACLDAAAKAQDLRNAHQLVEAREQLRVCAAPGCPSVVQNDCVTWSADVERSLPGVVVTAKDAAGVDLVDVTVTVDGQPFATRLTGQAVAMNGGLHLFHFSTASGATLDQRFVVKEGLKDQPVAVAFSASAPLSPSVAAPAAGAPLASSSAERPSKLRLAGWIVGGVGAAGVLVGAVAGGVAVSDKSGADCANNVCQGSLSGARTMANVADAGLIAGGVLVAGGAALVLFAPRGKASASGLRVLPTLLANGGGLVAGGSF